MNKERLVKKIIERVRKERDKALFYYTLKFDGITINKKNIA